MWGTFIGFGEAESKRVEEVCASIAKKDKSFVYRIGPMFEKFRGKYPYLLLVESKTREQAVKRGLLLVRRYLPEFNLLFWVEEIGEPGEDAEGSV
ncbi:MAG: hypothetical protein QW687_01585 [Candidatus Hadarchaeales archaeon]